ncbi:hypothetical protein BJX65DRAFT_316104 [Aspergillus insuetus]
MLAPRVANLGVGGIGLAIARRLGASRHLLVADISPKSLEHAANNLTADGHDVETHTVDVINYAAVQDFAPGVATDQASTQKILDVNILGTANFISTFQARATAQMSMVCIASVASYFAGDVSPELERHLALAPLDSLLGHEELKMARINLVSPGAVITAIGRAALAGPQVEYYCRQIEGALMGRSGLVDEVASVVAFLAGPESLFVTGADFFGG